jgi:hypothetical protein
MYRAFDHRQMRTVCDALDAPTLKGPLQRQLQRSAASHEVRTFAVMFSQLQDARQRADYDPQAEFPPAKTTDWIDLAETAIGAFERIPDAERAAVLALMIVRPRT